MKRLLISVVLLLLTAGTAGAVGLNLSWNNCTPSAGAVQDQTFICDDSSPGAMDANTQVFVMYGSVIPGFDLTGLIAWGAVIDIQVANSTLDDWWKLAGGECREGGVSFTYNGFTNTTTCNKQMMVASPAPLGIADYQDPGNNLPAGKPANWARYAPAVVRTTGFNVVGTTQYQLFAVAIDSHNTKVNGDGTTVACAGCSDPACIVLNSVELDVPAAQQPPDGKNFVTSEDTRRWVTWQGGSIGGAGCPANVPTKRTSWGQVKSLYR